MDFMDTVYAIGRGFRRASVSMNATDDEKHAFSFAVGVELAVTHPEWAQWFYSRLVKDGLDDRKLVDAIIREFPVESQEVR